MQLQSLWRGQKARKVLKMWQGKRHACATFLQVWWKRHLDLLLAEEDSRETLSGWLSSILALGYSRDPVALRSTPELLRKAH